MNPTRPLAVRTRVHPATFSSGMTFSPEATHVSTGKEVPGPVRRFTLSSATTTARES
jgi:hypothetical protein